MTGTELAEEDIALERTDSGTFARWGRARPAKKTLRDLIRPATTIIAIGIMGAAFFSFGSYWFAILLGLSLAALFKAVYENVRDAPKGLRALAPYPSAEAVFPVRATLRRYGVEYGSDDGAVTFSDGWLHYEGLAFSCSVRNCDGVLRLDNPYLLVVRFHGGYEMSMKVYISWGGGTPKVWRRDARLAAERWSYAPAPEGESVYPPRRFRSKPAVWSPPFVWGGIVVAMWAAVLWSLTANVFDGSSVSILLVFFLDIAGTLHVRRLGRTYRTLLPQKAAD